MHIREENKTDPGYITREELAEGVYCEWTQTDDVVSVIMYVSSVINRRDEVDMQVTDTELAVRIADTADFTCKFYAEVESDSTRVKLKKGSRSFTVTLKKATEEHWKTFMKPVSADEDIQTASTEQLITDHQETSSSEEEDADRPDGHTNNDVYELSHAKHDWYEKGEKCEWMVVNLYVKQIKKEALQVDFQETSITIRFQTSDKKFLSYHSDTTDDTLFSWKVRLKDSLDKDNCKYKAGSSVIEMTLRKKNPGRWGDLQAPEIKRGSAPATNIWVSTAKQQTNLAAVRPSQSEPLLEREVIPLSYPSKSSKNVEDKDDKQATQRMFHDSGDTLKDKPTCMVSPLNMSKTGKMVVNPGMTGLENLGNTCFMNSVIQVLANTRELRDFFLEGRFQSEINTDNPLGTSGKIAVAFAVCLKVLWSGKHHTYSPVKLKNIVASKASQFTGFAQHDAQEFMAFLLDGLHEDLNRVKDKPYTQNIDSDGRPDEIVAKEAWDIHKQRNDSFVVDLFQGQYKSKLVCPECDKVSITFDPFMILPVPLPKKQIYVSVFFLSKDPYRKPVRYSLKVSKDSTFDYVKEGLSRRTGVSPAYMKAFVTHKGKISFFLGRGDTLSNVSPTDKIIVCEVLSERQAGEQVLEIAVLQRTVLPHQVLTKCSHCLSECPPSKKLKRCSKCYKVAYCDQSCQTKDWHSRHRTQCKLSPDVLGCPFIISVPESVATYSRIANMMELYARHSVELFRPPVMLDKQNTQSEATVSSKDVAMETSPDSENADLPKSPDAESHEEMLTENVTEKQSADSSDGADISSPECDRGSHQTLPGSGIPVQFVPGKPQYVPGQQSHFFIKPCDKDGKSKGDRLADEGDNALDLSSIFFLAMDWNNNEKSRSYVLVKSKELEFDEDEGNASPSEDNGNLSLSQCLESFTEPEVLSPEHAWFCPQCKEHREASKQLSIWKLPDTLIIQLKRFSFRNMLWRDKIDKTVDFPVSGLDMGKYYIGNRPVSEPPPVYDLYGVVNHYGGILGGHYTSFGRCCLQDSDKGCDVDWRLFDDSMVSWVGNRSIVSRAAYVLFYRRRKHTFSPLDDVALLKKAPDYAETVSEYSETTDDSSTTQKKADNMEDCVLAAEKSAAYINEENTQTNQTIDGDKDEDIDDSEPQHLTSGKDLIYLCEPLPYTDMDAVD